MITKTIGTYVVSGLLIMGGSRAVSAPRPVSNDTASSISDVPAWAKKVVWYQIVTERFRNGDTTNDPSALEVAGAWPHTRPAQWHVSPWTSDWYKVQPWENDGKGFYYHAQQRRYGGDLQGVIAKLPYLKSLGVNALYFTPLFEAPSLHKYDASCYHHIDKNFGPDPAGDLAIRAKENPADPATWQWTSADRLFLSLIAKAHALGMKVIIDGVFNHVGTHFWAFEDVRKNGERSAYKDWFRIKRFDDPATPEDEFSYVGWMGVRDLPEFRKDSTGMAKGPHDHVRAIVSRWMDPNGDGNHSDGIDGWRLDVAEFIPQGFWREFRTWVRSINPEAYITGEIWWQDWPNEKMFNPTPWLQGDEFDAVMNYRVAREACRFFKDKKEKITASEFDRRLRAFRNDVRADANHVLMGLLDSHDTDRLASMIVNVDTHYDKRVGVGDNHDYLVRKPNAEERQTQKLMVVFQMTALAAPMVYYGDEAGMWGADDPDERKPMLWDDMTFENERSHPFGAVRPDDPNAFDHELFDWYHALISLRLSTPSLMLGDVQTVAIADSKDALAFLRTYNDEYTLVVLNNSRESQTLEISLDGPLHAASWKKVFGSGSFGTSKGKVRASVDAHSALILTAGQ